MVVLNDPAQIAVAAEVVTCVTQKHKTQAPGRGEEAGKVHMIYLMYGKPLFVEQRHVNGSRCSS